MTTFLLVRHGAHDLLGKVLAGRTPGVALNALGRSQAEALVQRLREREIHAIHSSPQLRTLQTAAPLAAQRGLPLQSDPAFDEVDYGRWTGLDLSQLRAEGACWNAWVERRSAACPPGGEPFAQLQARAMAGVARLRAAHPAQSVAVVTHGDVVKAVLAGILGLSLDHVERIAIAPASLSIVETGDGWEQVSLVNSS